MASVAQATSDRNKTHLRVGVITKPHGVRGELKVRLYFESSTALEDAEQVVVEPERGEARNLAIESVRGNPQKELIVALAGVASREDADALRSAQLWVTRSSQPALEPGEYYLVDLIGCGVFLEDKRIATVKDVRPDPSVDTMVLTMTDGSSAEVPIVDAWVGEVDVVAQRVELLSEDGIIS